MLDDLYLGLLWARQLVMRCNGSYKGYNASCGRNKGMSCGSCRQISRNNSLARKLGRKWKRNAQFSRIVDSPSLETCRGDNCVPDRRRRQLLARVCNFFLEDQEQGCSRKMAEISEYLQNTQLPASPLDTDSIVSDQDLHERAVAGLGFKEGSSGKKNTIVKVCDFFLDKKERGNEINIRAIITAIDQANCSSGLTPAERKAVEEKQRELLVKVCKILLDTKERGVETNIQEIWNAIRYTKLRDPAVYDRIEEMNIETEIQLEDSGKLNEDKELKRRKMIVYKFFLDSRERGMEDKTKQINRMLGVKSGVATANTTAG